MVTISRSVEKIIEEHPFMQEALARGVINYAALAEEIKPRVESELKTTIKDSAVMMALRRLTEKLEKTFVTKPKFDKNSDVFVKSDLFEITIKKSKRTFSLLKKIYEFIDSDADFLTITQGITQVTIISNKRNKKKIIEAVHGERIIKEIDNLCLIGTTIPMHSIEEVGYFYLVTRAFAWEDIPIVELVSTLTELNLIVNQKDVPRAFVVLKELVERNS